MALTSGSTSVRYVVVCQARTGTHLLRTSLEQHPQVRCTWEPFNDKVVEHFAYGVETPAGEILARLWSAERGVIASGFPIHLNHGRGGRAWSDVWRLLASDQDVKRVDLYRRNLLAQLVSHRRALRSGDWMVTEGEEVPNSGTVSLTPESCEAWFEATAEQIRRQLSEDASSTLVTYEDLAGNLNETLKALFLVLGLEPVGVRPVLKKQGTQLRSMVETFDELASAFKGSQWSSFFTDSGEHSWDEDLLSSASGSRQLVGEVLNARS
jgi:hypothetical protein